MTVDTTLPDAVRDALIVIDRRLEHRQSIEVDGAIAIHAIADLSLKNFVRDAYEIARLAGLRSWGRPSPFRALFSLTDNSEAAQLARQPWLGWLFLFHGDGYLRERALRSLDGPAPGAFLLAQLFYRLNDWVPEVRAAARACVERVAAATAPEIIATVAVALVDRTSEWGRWNDERAVLDGLLTRDDVASTVAQELMGSPIGPYARALRQVMRAAAIDPHLDRLATGAVQPAVRAVATLTLIDGVARWPDGWRWQWIDKSLGYRRRVREIAERPLSIVTDRTLVISRAARDPAATVRFAALEGVLRYARESATGTAIATLLAGDPVPRVRTRALFILSKSVEVSGGPDVT